MLAATVDEILEILDQGARDFIFPMLDNGYVYLAATRLHLYRSASDWAILFEIFGFSPRAGQPDLLVTAFTNDPVHNLTESEFVSEEAYRNHIQLYRHVEQSWFYPIDDSDWIDFDHGERIRPDATSLLLRGRRIPLPDAEAYADAGVALEEPPIPLIFELSRALAHQHRAKVLATKDELKTNLKPELQPILTLDDWHHPDVVDPEALPSRTETFRQLAALLVSGDTSLYAPAEAPNSHWSNWPFGGTL